MSKKNVEVYRCLTEVAAISKVKELKKRKGFEYKYGICPYGCTNEFLVSEEWRLKQLGVPIEMMKVV